MKSYLSYFRLRFLTGLQYRGAAIAGILTQIFFGLVFIMVYLAFYETDSSNAPMTLEQTISYLWLNQILFALVYMWYKDKDIFSVIKNGNISYELCRPLKLYWMWYSKIISQRLSAVLLRCIPALVVALLLPAPYGLGLPSDFLTFIVFLLTLTISTLLMTSIVTFYHVLAMFTLDDKGVTGIVVSCADILSGVVVPIPFFPQFLQKISNYLPFQYVSDLPFRIYISHIPLSQACQGIIVQILWTFILILLGYLLSKKALKKAVIQGG